jgi:tetratricopeptide (TPR) repeat protein
MIRVALRAAILACLAASALAATEIPEVDRSAMSKDVGEAFEWARAQVAKAPEDPAKWEMLGAGFDAHGFPAEAETCYRRALELQPGTFHLTYLIAVVMDMRGAPLDDVLAQYDKADAIESGYAPLHWRKGSALLRGGRAKEAQASFEKAVALGGGYPAARLGVAQAMLAQGDAKDALPILKVLREAAPEDRGVLSGLARAHSMLGEVDAAREAAEHSRGTSMTLPDRDSVRTRVNSLGISGQARMERARVAIVEGRHEDAAALLKQIVTTFPDSADAHALLGRELIAAGHADVALASLRRAIELDPRQPFPRIDLAYELLKAGKVDEAIVHLRVADKEAPQLGRAQTLLAIALAEAGLLDESVRHFEKAAALDSLGVAEWRQYGLALGRLERWKEAAKIYWTAVGLDTTDSATWYNLGLSLEKSGDLKQARTAHERSVSLDPLSRSAERLKELGAGK